MDAPSYPPEQMYTDEGNAALRAALTELVNRIAWGEVTRLDLPGEMQAVKARVSAAGHREVMDTEPEWHIVDTLNEACDAHGWTHVSRDDL